MHNGIDHGVGGTHNPILPRPVDHTDPQPADPDQNPITLDQRALATGPNPGALTLDNRPIGQRPSVDDLRRVAPVATPEIRDTLTCRPPPPPVCAPQEQLPALGCLPPPSIDLAGAPAGRGLELGPDGWPKTSIGTAGGYHIVGDGNTSWRIFEPGQKFTDQAGSTISGDPHVADRGGANWDFTKSSDFVLGDGTRIFVRTSAETGRSITTALDIVNGADHVTMSDIDKAAAKMSGVSHDGYEYRAQQIATNPDKDTFYLQGDKDHVHWLRERGGRFDGIVTGATFDEKSNRYEQTVDKNGARGLDASLRPPIGSRAWGNQLRSQLDDAQAEFFGRLGRGFGAPELGARAAVDNARTIHGNHDAQAWRSDLRDFTQYLSRLDPFGGLFGGLGARTGCFGGWGSYTDATQRPFDALSALRELLLHGSIWQSQYQSGRVNNATFR